jgi:ADP-ribosylglycohydrolase
MIGAIAGDIIGSVYEWENIKTKEFELFRPDCSFTDDSVLTVALAESILTGVDYSSLMRRITGGIRPRGMEDISTAGRRLTKASPTTAGATAPPCESVRLGLPSTR